MAKAINGRQTTNSGATAFSKGDVSTESVLVECKTCTKPQKTFTIHKEWLIKNQEEAFAMRKPYSALAFDFGDGEQNYIISEKLFKKLLRCLEEDSV